MVCSQLREHFVKLMDVGFTADMEDNLDKVADGKLGWVDLMKDFSRDFNPTLEAAAQHMAPVKGGLTTDVPCPECGKPLVVKFGKSGEFLACTGYPECRYTTNFTRDEKGRILPQERPKEEHQKVGVCPKCGGDVILKHSRTGSRFQSCSNYPRCDYAAPFSTGVSCPRCGKGTLVEKVPSEARYSTPATSTPSAISPYGTGRLRRPALNVSPRYWSSNRHGERAGI